jgi:DNA-directed RNA polymerase specialized sigma24 family protein/AmiR/NasT family two-component response regulator
MPKQIVRHAPYLRRYARALTGAQDRGDMLVQAAMEGLLTGVVKLDGGLPLRSGLYRALHQIWVRSAEHDDVEAASDCAEDFAPDRRLQVLSPDERAALLLTSMEGFTPGEAAQVLGTSYDELESRLMAADAALQVQLATDVLIIEDEPIIGLDLMRLTRELGHRVTGVAATRDEAVAMAKQFKPGLVLADIRLADGSSGMDAAADILKSFEIPIIFITAFPEHLLTGERPEPAFLITKPFREETVKALIGQALFFHRPRRQLAAAQEPAVSL